MLEVQAEINHLWSHKGRIGHELSNVAPFLQLTWHLWGGAGRAISVEGTPCQLQCWWQNGATIKEEEKKHPSAQLRSNWWLGLGFACAPCKRGNLLEGNTPSIDLTSVLFIQIQHYQSAALSVVKEQHHTVDK